jgi:hypothetical protein
MWEPVGSWTVISTAPALPRIRFLAGMVPVMRRTPSPYSTVVCCAAVTSRVYAASAGRISTVASARSAAMNRTRPAGMFRTAEIGAGVANVCISHSFDTLFLT